MALKTLDEIKVNDPNVQSLSFIQNEIKKDIVIPLNTLIFWIFFFLVGIVATLIFQKISSNESISVSSLDLLTFTFSIALTGASIILAMVAIDLGKKSEQTTMMQNNESLRLQNEIFVKTNDTLQKIGTSTGITEKRIEDIISGRISNISQNIANTMVDQEFVKKNDLDNLEKSIQKTIFKELRKDTNYPNYSILGTTPTDISEVDPRLKSEARKNLDMFNMSILYGIVNLNKYSVLKIGEGRLTGEGQDAIDGIFKKDDKIFGICTFLNEYTKLSKPNEETVNTFFNTLLNEIASKNLYKIFLVYDQEISEDNIYNKVWKNLKIYSKKEIIDNIIFLHGSIEEVSSQIDKELQ